MAVHECNRFGEQPEITLACLGRSHGATSPGTRVE